MLDPFERVADAIDLEAFLICSGEEEAGQLARALAAKLGLPECDILFLEQRGPGARVRLRAYLHRPGDSYGWLPAGSPPEEQ